MKSFGQKSWMLSQPVLIIGTYDKNGNPNAMNRWSSESRSQTCLDYAESQARKAKSNRKVKRDRSKGDNVGQPFSETVAQHQQILLIC